MNTKLRTQRYNLIRATIQDTVGSFLYYDRKEDEDLPRGSIEEAILMGEITAEEIGDAFIQVLKHGLGLH